MSTPDKRYVARAELVIAGHPRDSLRDVPLQPDPLDAFGRVMERALDDEQLTVTIDLVPLTRGQQRRWIKRQLEDAHALRKPTRAGGSGKKSSDPFGELLEGLGDFGANVPTTVSQGQQLSHSRRGKALTRRLDEAALFNVQVLVRVETFGRDRAKGLVKDLVNPFRTWNSGTAHWRVRGRSAGAFLGSDLPLVRRWFDWRQRTAFVRAPRRNVVGVSEISGLLKPPSKHASSEAWVRTAGVVAAPPRSIKLYRRQRGVLPIGSITTAQGKPEVAGQALDEFFFGLLCGRARFGKTETALVQLAHLALVEKAGCMFVDPHRDAIERIKPYLATIGDRVIELDMTKSAPHLRHVAMNPVSMHGRPLERMYQRVGVLVDVVAIVAQWSPSATRSRQIATATFSALSTLSLRLPPELSPTILTALRLLEDEEWRERVVPFLPPSQRTWWEGTFAGYGSDATSPMTNAIRRLTASPIAQATLGSPVSTYDARKAMDNGMVILASPGSSKERALNSLIVFDAITAGKSREDLPPAQRHPFYMFTDEAQSWDDGQLVPELVQETGKYGLRLQVMAQSPGALSEQTRRAMGTNGSILMSTAQDVEGDRWFAAQMRSDPGLMQDLPRYHFLAQVTESAKRCAPFRVGGLSLEMAWRDVHRPDLLPQLEAQMDKAFRPRTIEQTLQMIEGHDDRLAAALYAGGPGPAVPDLPPLEEPPSFLGTRFD